MMGLEWTSLLMDWKYLKDGKMEIVLNTEKISVAMEHLVQKIRMKTPQWSSMERFSIWKQILLTDKP